MRKVFCGSSGINEMSETHKLSDIPLEEGLKKSLINHFGTDFALRPAQEAALFEHRIQLKSENVIITTPTNSGKSLISYILLLQKAFTGNRVVLIEPLRALAYEKGLELNTIVSTIKRDTGVNIKIIVTTGDYRTTSETMFSKPDNSDRQKGQIIIATPERLDALSRVPENKEWFDSISTVVLDEAHLIGDAQRGTTIELLMTYLYLLPSKPRLILMSATISNAGALSNWIAPCGVIDSVPRYPMLEKWVYILDDGEKADDTLIDEIQGILNTKGTSAIVFVYQTASAETLAVKIAESFSGSKIVKKDLSKVMDRGVAWFHSQLSTATKERILEAMNSGAVKVTVSTTALAMGINLPATHVFVRDISFAGFKDLDTSDLMQMLGRAGRGDMNGTGVVLLSGKNVSKEASIVSGLTNEIVPQVTSQMILPEQNNYYGTSKPDERYLDQACAQIMGILSRTGSMTVNSLEEYLNHTFAGKQFSEIQTLLSQLSRWKLAYKDESTNEYQLTRLGSVGCNCYMPPSSVANIGQFIRDLLSDDPSGLHLKKFTDIDYLILLCLSSNEIRPIGRYSKAMEAKIEGYMESLPLQEKSYLYQKWIKTDPDSIMGSARISVPSKENRKIALQATFTGMFLYELSRGHPSTVLDKYYSVNTDEIQEKYRDNLIWLLFGLEKMMEVRCFYYHLKENCEAPPEMVNSVEHALRQCSSKIFDLISNVKFRSVFGEMIRGIKRVYKKADRYPSDGTIRKLESAGILSLRDLIGKKPQDLVSIGIKKEYADLIIGYIRKRAQ